jgi:hypothetical protein
LSGQSFSKVYQNRVYEFKLRLKARFSTFRLCITGLLRDDILKDASKLLGKRFR